MDQHSFLHSSIIYLLAAVIAVPIAKRLGLGSVLGYLFAGIIIGPFALQLISHPEEILHFAEFGVVLLLFLIGLELNPGKLWQLRKPILGTGGAQVILTSAAFCAIGTLWLGLDFSLALIAGMGLSLSSTALVLQVLNEKNLLPTAAGRSSFATLLFQDIAVIPMLAIVPLLGVVEVTTNPQPLWLSISKVVVVIAAIILGGRYVLRYLFRFVAATDSREIFVAFSLLLVIGIALMMEAVGMSMALGTFLAGVLLADSEYRHELEINIEPFKGLLLGLFFISVGMSIDFGLLLSQPLTILSLMLILVTVKLTLLLLIALISGLRSADMILFALILSQGGEFAFVLFNVATEAKILDQEINATLVVAVAMSMITTPLLMIIYEKFVQPRFNRSIEQAADAMAEENPVIIAGFGRFGQIVNRMLHGKRIATTVIDHDPNQIELVRRFEQKAFYGDITRLDLLHAAGADKARLLILAIDDIQAALETAKLAKQHFPNLEILARVSNRQEVYEFMKLDVKIIIRETFGSALEMGEQALNALGMGAYRARGVRHQFRLHDLQTIQHLYPDHQDEKSLISKTRQAREDLERLLNSEDDELLEQDEHSHWG